MIKKQKPITTVCSVDLSCSVGQIIDSNEVDLNSDTKVGPSHGGCGVILIRL